MFGATAEGAPVLAAMRALPDLLAYRSRLPVPLIPGRLIDDGVVTGPWRRLVFGHPAHEGGAVSRHAYDSRVLLAAPRSTLPVYTSASAGSISHSGQPNQA